MARRAGQCELDARAETSAALVATGAAGVLLFSLADVLSTSQMFRLGAGSMVFTSGSLIILLVLLFRCAVRSSAGQRRQSHPSLPRSAKQEGGGTRTGVKTKKGGEPVARRAATTCRSAARCATDQPAYKATSSALSMLPLLPPPRAPP